MNTRAIYISWQLRERDSSDSRNLRSIFYYLTIVKICSLRCKFQNRMSFTNWDSTLSKQSFVRTISGQMKFLLCFLIVLLSYFERCNNNVFAKWIIRLHRNLTDLSFYSINLIFFFLSSFNSRFYLNSFELNFRESVWTFIVRSFYACIKIIIKRDYHAYLLVKFETNLVKEKKKTILESLSILFILKFSTNG